MSSHGSFIRAITASLRSQCVPATRISIYSKNCTTSAVRQCRYKHAQHLQQWPPCRSISTSSRMYQGQAAAVSTQKPSTSTPSSTPTKPSSQSSSTQTTSADLKAGLSDQPNMSADEKAQHVDWSTSFHGLADAPFSKEAASVLLQPLKAGDVEIKPDGIIYLPEIKYRRVLNQAFGPGGWGLAPRGASTVTAKAVTREYALLAHGRLVSIARGEQDYFSPDGIPTAAEGCKSNAMMRCCKDLGVASELWDPQFIRQFKSEHAKNVWVEHVVTKKKQKIWVRKDSEVQYPWKESRASGL